MNGPRGAVWERYLVQVPQWSLSGNVDKPSAVGRVQTCAGKPHWI